MNETANEIKRLQGCINDLIGVLALPALWKGQDANQIVKTLLDVLVGMLRLDFAYVRLKDPVGGGLIEMLLHDQFRHLAAEPGLVGQTLTQSLGANPRKWPPRAKNPFGEGSLSIVPLGSGRENDIGVIVAASQRSDFPWQTETVVLSVAANQAAIGLASARAYEQERQRIEAELERQKLSASMAERLRIARDLHDTLLQSFQGSLWLLYAVSTKLAESALKQELDRALDAAAQAIAEGRDAIQGMRVERNDLAESLRTLGEELVAANNRPQPMAFTVQVLGVTREMEPILRDETYRIAGEALRNAFRYADAQHIEVEIRYDERELRLRVRDDGKGIDPKLLSDQGRAGHFGLRGMKERAKLAGELTVRSGLQTGTEVELSIPLAPTPTGTAATVSAT